MIIKQELINKIKDYFDLNIYETKVWVALLVKGSATAGEIAEISGVPRSRTYDVLEGLEKQGFVMIQLGKPVKYLAIKPCIILEKLKKNAVKRAEEKISFLSKIKSTEEYLKLEELHKEGIIPIRREDISASLRGKSNISSHLREILQNAKKEVMICADAEDIITKFKIFKQTIDRLSDSKINLKMALTGDSKVIERLKSQLGVKIKKINIKGKFFIIDRKEVLFYITKGSDEEDLAVWINSEFFAEALASLFDKALKTGGN